VGVLGQGDREVLLPGRRPGGDPALQSLDPDQGPGVALAARLGALELALGGDARFAWCRRG